MVLLLFGVIVFATFSCEKEEVLPAYQAKGKIIQLFGWCYGSSVMIEVENPKGIGMPGTFAFPGREDARINYRNAITVPHFDRVSDLNTEAPMAIGTWLYFEYRNVEEVDRDLFRTFPPPLCNASIISPPSKGYIITKIIDYR